MQLTRISVAGYRSLDRIDLDLARITVVRGGNGTGKSNLYRALGIAGAAAGGSLAADIAAQGGMASLLWAGRRRKGPQRARVQVSWEDVRYSLELGLPQRVLDDPFSLEPEVKTERIEAPDGRRWLTLGERDNGSAFLRDDDGNRVTFPLALWRGESVLSQVVDPRRFGIVAEIRARLLAWRLYHQFRVDPESPARQPQPGVRTPALAADGHDLASAVATIRFAGQSARFADHVDAAFPGSEVRAVTGDDGRFDIEMTMPGLLRPLRGVELSDGTLRYLCLLSALTAVRPPPLVTFNEPEASLHPRLLEPLAHLFAAASAETQILITTHSADLADRVARAAPDTTRGYELEVRAGATSARPLDGPRELAKESDPTLRVRTD